jgi:peptidoglycan-associated lipoprotein
MGKSLLFLVAFVSVIFSGCSQKAPEVEPVVINNKNTPVKKVEENAQIHNSVPTDTIDSGIVDEDIEKLKSVGIDSKNVAIENVNGIEPVYFAFDKFVISDRELDKVYNNAKIIKARGVSKVRIEGNCDEWGTDEYNYALGLKRAKSAKEALAVSGVDRSKISIVSYGEGKPVCAEHNDACWQRNRRVDFKIVN